MLPAALVTLLLLPGDVAHAVAAADEARTTLVANGGSLWGPALAKVAWVFVAGERIYFTESPNDESFPAYEDIWMGPLPGGIAAANTSVSIARRRWAMVRLPVPTDKAAAVRLLIHEAFHVVEPDVLGLPPASEGGAGAELLEGPVGRSLLIAEWRALAQALVESGPAEAAAVERALVFRARRYLEASPQERLREQLLDVSEGLAEYTAWKLVGGEETLPRRLREEAPAADSFVRSFPYTTGPAYALLLDRRLPGWKARLKTSPDLQRLLAETLPRRVAGWLDGKDAAGLRKAAEKAGASVGLPEIRTAEEARARARAAHLADLRARFVTGPTLRIRPGPLHVSFNPNTQISLGSDGTIMPGLVWKDEAGAILEAPGGALVTTDWRDLVLPLPAEKLPETRFISPLDLTGDGWKLHLPAGWTPRREGMSVIIVP